MSKYKRDRLFETDIHLLVFMALLILLLSMVLSPWLSFMIVTVILIAGLYVVYWVLKYAIEQFKFKF